MWVNVGKIYMLLIWALYHLYDSLKGFVLHIDIHIYIAPSYYVWVHLVSLKFARNASVWMKTLWGPRIPVGNKTNCAMYTLAQPVCGTRSAILNTKTIVSYYYYSFMVAPGTHNGWGGQWLHGMRSLSDTFTWAVVGIETFPLRTALRRDINGILLLSRGFDVFVFVLFNYTWPQ